MLSDVFTADGIAPKAAAMLIDISIGVVFRFFPIRLTPRSNIFDIDTPIAIEKESYFTMVRLASRNRHGLVKQNKFEGGEISSAFFISCNVAA
ncbi:hypothetical protein [Chitiniphilus eburneus]|uniref:Uncharacterized protein n=1 Tax=Chitiniphilus eburneus TaxID=2571148 RepID=A0A4U0PZZ8_9NEIS|nr:hypothetical protein [Chitiniphilus eburneus]TJZ74205.1 hypothetical protein FAZ21_07900 [Chitiniphilus eburneus]